MIATQINLNQLELSHGDYTSVEDMSNMVHDSKDCGFIPDQFMSFIVNGKDFCVSFETEYEGRLIVEKGDYYTPDYTYVEYNFQDISIRAASFDEEEIVLTPEVVKALEKVIKLHL